jgi:hypothetical protein
MRDTVAGPALENLAGTELPTRVITYAWGEKYLDDLLSFTLPALLAPENLPFVAAHVPCELVLLTEERFFPSLGTAPVVARMRAICPVRLISLDDLISSPDKYGIALTFVLHRGLADLGPAITDCWCIFLNADFILANGSLRTLLAHLMRGERIVASPSYCVTANTCTPLLRKRIDPSTDVLAVPSRELARIAIDHRHNTVRSKTVNQEAFHIRYMDQFYWLLDPNTLLGHQMPVAIVGMRAERQVVQPNSFWDYGLMKEFCPDAEVVVIGDSDEFLMIELRDKEVAQEQLLAGPAQPKELAELMVTWVTPYQRQFASRPLTLHAVELPRNVDVGRRNLVEFVDKIFSYVPEHLPSHIDHPQWNYHWQGFIEGRHRFLSARLGSQTETNEPPASVSLVDQCWWKLDGVTKAYARRRAELESLIACEISLLNSALAKVDRESTPSMDKFVNDLLKAKADTAAQPVEIFENVRLASALQIPSNEEKSLPSEWEDIFRRYEQEHVALEDKATVKRKQLLEGIEQLKKYLQVRLSSLKLEFEAEQRPLKTKYEQLLRKSLGTPVIPFVRLRKGRKVAVARHESAPIRLIRQGYRRIYGEWPHVTQLSGYWASFRHLLHIVETAKARGAKDALLIGNHVNIVENIVDLEGFHAWVSVPGVKSGNFAKAFDERPEFDLCICDLGLSELTQFSEIYESVRPFMRPGGTVVGFHFNPDGVRTAPELSRSMPSGANIYYAGSKRTMKILRAFRPVGSAAGPLRLAGMAIAIALTSPHAYWANRIEAATPLGQAAPAEFTSITMEIRVGR